MAGVDLEVPLQGTDPLQGAQQLLRVAAGQVRPPAAAAKERVSGEEGVLAAQGHPAGGVARGADHLEAQGADLHPVPVGIVFPVFGKVEGKVEVPPGFGVVLPVQIDPGAGLLRQGLHRAHVVKVPVGQENGPAAQAVLLQVVQDGVALVAGVDDGAVQARLVGDHVAVGLQLADGYGLDQHFKAPLCPAEW